MPLDFFTGDTEPVPLPPVYLTSSQQAVFDTLLDLGLLHYGGFGEPDGTGLRPRLYPLVCAPTGAGKSFLVERAARLLGADYFRATFGEWIPLGTRDPRNATLVRLGQLLTRSRRVVAHVDELDKWLVGDREWGRSLSNDLWNLLDGKLPWELVRQLAAEDEQDGAAHPAPPARPVIPGCTGQLWIVGSGTWQSVFEHRRAPQLGFGPRTSGAGDPRDLAEEIRRSKAIPTELSARFASDLLFLDYPDADETEHLLGTFGIRELAAEVGVAVSAADVDYQSAGMRALESLKTRLLLLRVRKERGAAPDPDHAAPIAAPELGI